MSDKTRAIVAHITIIGWLIAFFGNQSEKGELTSFYLRQLLGLTLLGIAGSLVGSLTLNIIGSIVGVLVLILFIISLLGAISGKASLTPILGEKFQEWFKGIS